MLLELIGASLLVMMASLFGVFTIWKQAGTAIERNINFLVSFAAGVFLILVLFLGQEVITGASSVTIGLFWIVLGLVLVWFLVKFIPEGHHHHDIENETAHSKLDSRKMLIGDSIHNIGDGILLAASFLINPALGFTTTISILFHEMVQEVSEFFILKQAGFSTTGALRINFYTASTILIGSIGGYFMLEKFSVLAIPVLGLATGALIALLLEDLLPHSLEHAKEKKCIYKHLIAFATGAIIMSGIFLTTMELHGHNQTESNVTIVRN